MKVEELATEVATTDSHLAHLQQADNPDYDVYIEVEAGLLIPVKGVRWEHDEKLMVIEAA